MGIFQKIFGTPDSDSGAAIDARVDALVTQRAREAAHARIAEARPYDDDDDWAFRLLTGKGESRYAIPAAFQERVIRDSNWLCQSDGLASRMLQRSVSIALEGGLQYTVEFDEGFPDLYRAAIVKRLAEFWNGEQADIQNRVTELVADVLKDGEGGLILARDAATGRVAVGSISRDDTTDLIFDDFDRRALRGVRMGDPNNATEAVTLRALSIDRSPESASYRHLTGDVLYFRFGATASIRRGAPLLQQVVDDVRVAKKFRILATDRMVARLSLFMDTELTGMSDEQIAEFVRTHGTAIPSQGHRFIHSEGVKNTFLSATLEAGDINATIQTQTIGIVGALGHPISWYGYGDGSTRATAETQQTPAAMDMKRFKGQIIEALQTLLYYVADAAILSRYVSSDPSVTPLTEIDVKDPDGNPARRIMRECIAITVSTIPSAPQQAKSLAVTKDAVAVIASDDSGAELSGKRMLTDDKRRALMNWALAADGVDIEVEAFEEAAKAEEDPYAV